MTKQCTSCGGDCGRTKESGCQRISNSNYRVLNIHGNYEKYIAYQIQRHQTTIKYLEAQLEQALSFNHRMNYKEKQ